MDERSARLAANEAIFRAGNELIATQFVVLPGHENGGVERVVVTNERFLVVEKTGEAGRQAEATDPRD